MNLTETGTLVEPAGVRFERQLPGPIERVWAYLTEADKRRRWLADGAVEERVGGRIELEFRHAELSPHADDGKAEAGVDMPDCVTLSARVTACEPPRLLEHTWPETDGESLVRFELSEHGDGVKLVVVHTKLVTRGLRVDVAAGWHTHLDLLRDQLEGGSPGPFWPRFAELKRGYDERVPGA
ncbi:MAG: SRPBCC family protein [Pseudomonadota bacterium]